MNQTIETINNWGARYLEFAWPMLWQSSLLILIVLALNWALARKLRASIRHALWLVVLVKLLLPPTLALPTGIAWWLTPAKYQPPLPKYTVTYSQSAAPIEMTLPMVPLPKPPPPQLNRAGEILLGATAISAALLTWLLIRWIQVAALVRRAIDAPTLADSLAAARRRTRLRRRVRLKLVDDRLSPAVCGLFRPVILLPRRVAEHLTENQLQAVLLHELIHLRRWDIWTNCAQALLQILYWWHPLVWLANSRLRRVREEAVDDAVMLALQEDAELYAPTLLEVAKLAFHRPSLSLGLVGIMESRSALRQRIERLMEFRAPRRAGLTLASMFAILAFSAVALPMGSAPGQTDQPIVAIPINPPIRPDVAVATTGSVVAIDSNTGLPIAGSAGAAIDPRTGLPIAGSAGAVVDPKTGLPIAGGTVAAIDPNTGLPANQLLTRVFKVDPVVFPSALQHAVKIAPAPTGSEDSGTNISSQMRALCRSVGIDLMSPPGKAIFYNDRQGMLLVKATSSDLDTIDKIVETFNQVPPQIHLKARFYQVPPGTADGFTQFLNASTNTGSGLTGILTPDNAKALMKSLQAMKGAETLAEPEVVTANGRQTQMRATHAVNVITNVVCEQNPTNLSGVCTTFEIGPIEFGPVLDTTAHVLADNYTILLQAIPSDTEFWGYAKVPTNTPPQMATNAMGRTISLPTIWPVIQKRQNQAFVNLYDDQTLLMVLDGAQIARFGSPDEKRDTIVAKHIQDGEKTNHAGQIIVLITATIIDPAGNRIHEDYMDFQRASVPVQPPQLNLGTPPPSRPGQWLQYYYDSPDGSSGTGKRSRQY